MTRSRIEKALATGMMEFVRAETISRSDFR
jgi:hypothetical protein